MDAGTVLGRGISFPPRVGVDGRVVWSAGEVNVQESIRVILETNLSERVRLAEFGGGLRRFLFEPNTTTTRRQIQDRITTALTRWEPRIQIESVRVDEDADADSATATIEYRLVATQVQGRVSLTLLLSG
jgi:hypothetical protein